MSYGYRGFFRPYFLVAVEKIIQGGDRFVAKVELKQPVVQAIVEDIKDAQSAVLVNYCGLTVDGAPKVIKEAASKAEAEEIKAKLEAEGASVTLK